MCYSIEVVAGDSLAAFLERLFEWFPFGVFPRVPGPQYCGCSVIGNASGLHPEVEGSSPSTLHYGQVAQGIERLLAKQ